MWYICTYACWCVCPCLYREARKGQQGLSLNLEPCQWPANSSDPPVSVTALELVMTWTLVIPIQVLILVQLSPQPQHQYFFFKLFSVSNVNPRRKSHSPLTRDYTYIQNHTALGQQVGSAGKALVLKPEFDPQNRVEHLQASSVPALLLSDGRWRQRKPPESSWATKPRGGSTGKTTKTPHQQGYPTPESYLLTSTCAHTLTCKIQKQRQSRAGISFRVWLAGASWDLTSDHCCFIIKSLPCHSFSLSSKILI